MTPCLVALAARQVDVKAVKATMHASIQNCMAEPRRKSAGGTEQPRAMDFTELFEQATAGLGKVALRVLK